MQNLYKDLEKILEKDERLFAEGKILKNKATELAMKLDKELLKILLKDKKIKEHFFVDIEKALVFDKDKFVKFINNKEFLPDSFTSFKNHIGLTKDDEYLKDSGNVVLAWPYKDCVLEGGQDKEDKKRNEIFYNEILAPDEIDRLFEPKVLTNFKKIDKSGEHKVDKITEQDNLIIKGNNLLVLHSLKKKYRGKIKLIYIDPPYNTQGSADTFTYNNSFTHSAWLTFMKNRLYTAKEFLREDGFIAIAIDHYELFYLGALADEVFGRENRVGIITVVHKPEGRQFANFFSASNEFMLVYAKDKSLAEFENVILDKVKQETFDNFDEKSSFRLKNFIRLTDGKYSLRKNKPEGFYPIYVSKDLKNFSLVKKEDYETALPITDKSVERVWKTSGKTFLEKAKSGEIVAKKENGKIVLYEKLRASQVFTTHWVNKKYHSYHFGTKLLEDILGKKEFSFPKSIYTVLDTLKIMTSGDDIIMDFFAGSGTTGHATLELNKEDKGSRKFILVEQLDGHIDVCIKRIKKLLENEAKTNFIFTELKKWNEVYIQNIQEAKTEKEILSLYKKMQKEAFFRYEIDLSKFQEKEFSKLALEDQKKALFECLDKNHLYVNYGEINDATYKISAEEKKINKQFYGN